MNTDKARLVARLPARTQRQTEMRIGTVLVDNLDGTIDVDLAGTTLTVPVVPVAPAVGAPIPLVVWDGNLVALAALLVTTGNTLSFWVNGVEMLRLTEGANDQVFLGPAGSTTVPNLSLITDPNSGLSLKGGDAGSMIMGGVQQMMWTTAGTQIIGELVRNDFSGATNKIGFVGAGWEIGRTDGTVATPSIDFHMGDDVNYNARLLGSGGASGLAGGSLAFLGVRFNMTSGFFGFGASTTLTIATGVVTAIRSYHLIDTQSAAASDDLDTISGGADGDLLIIGAANDARTVVCKDGTGNLRMVGDFSLTHTDDKISFIKVGSNWHETARSDNAA